MRIRWSLAALGAALCLAPCVAAGETPSGPRAEVSALGAYYSDGDLSGPAGGVQALWLRGRYLGLGVSLDTAWLTAAGQAVRGPYEYTLSSTLVSGKLQGRLPLGRVVPYAQLGIGIVNAARISSLNVGCNHDSGLGGSAAVGTDIVVSGSLTAGVQLSWRLASYTMTCNAALGPHHFRGLWLRGVGASLGYRL